MWYTAHEKSQTLDSRLNGWKGFYFPIKPEYYLGMHQLKLSTTIQGQESPTKAPSHPVTL